MCHCVPSNATTASHRSAAHETICSTMTPVLLMQGHFSPIVRQARWGQTPEGVCLVVGACNRGHSAEANTTGAQMHTCFAAACTMSSSGKGIMSWPGAQQQLIRCRGPDLHKQPISCGQQRQQQQKQWQQHPAAGSRQLPVLLGGVPKRQRPHRPHHIPVQVIAGCPVDSVQQQTRPCLQQLNAVLRCLSSKCSGA
jgi:hypothetical protein